MDAHQEARVLHLYGNMREEWPMELGEYKRHLLNHMSYSHAYLSGANVELAGADPQALCEAAMHAAACAWCISDYHNEATPPEPIPAEAWEGIASRWVKAVEKWSKQLRSNQAAAYAAPIRERAALRELPPISGTRSAHASGVPENATGSRAADGVTATKRSGASSNGPIIGSGAASPSDAASRAAFYAPPTAKRSHKKAPSKTSR